MSPLARIVLSVIGLAVVSWVLYATAQRMYFAPRAALQQRIDEASERVNSYREALDARHEVAAAQQALVNRTLGPDVETVDHRLRTRLNRLAADVGLAGTTVGTTSPSARQTPARAQFRGPAFMRELRDELDFIELEGSIAGEGTLEQIVTLLDWLDAEPWIKRIQSVRLDPQQNGERMAAAIRLTTLFVPGRAPDAEPDTPYDPGRLDRFAFVLGANPFRLPPPEPEAPAMAEQTPSRTVRPQFPYAQWFVTGIAEGQAGGEAWLLNRSSGESRRLAVGETLEKLELVATAVDYAEFTVDEQRFRVAVGASLNDRTPVKR